MKTATLFTVLLFLCFKSNMALASCNQSLYDFRDEQNRAIALGVLEEGLGVELAERSAIGVINQCATELVPQYGSIISSLSKKCEQALQRKRKRLGVVTTTDKKMVSICRAQVMEFVNSLRPLDDSL